MRRKTALLGTLLLAACTLAACGSSGSSAEDEAGAAAARALEAKSAKEFCRRLASERLIEEAVAGGRAACEKASVVAEDPGGVRVTAVSLQGEDDSRAEVGVEIEGGESGGVSGRLELVRQGDRWLLDRYGEDFLRSSLRVAIRKADKGAFGNERMKDCMGAQLAKLSEERLREIARAATSGGEVLVEALRPFAENCPAALAEYGADEFTKGLADDGKNSPAYVKCLHDELESLLLLTDISPDLLGETPNSAAVFALEGIAAGAKRNCIGER
jgi:hypothetical protein